MRPIVAVCLLIVLLVAPRPSSALDGKLGVHLSPTSNRFSGDLPAEGSWKGAARLGGGLVLEYDFAPDVSLSLQPSYAPRASEQVFKVNGQVAGTIEYDVNYISLPLLVRVTGDPVGVRGFVTAGLELDILIDATVDRGDGAEDVSDVYNDMSFGALLGAGVMVPLGPNFLSFEFRYVQGLADIINRDADEEGEAGLTSSSIKYSGIQLQIGYLFQLGGD